MTIFADAGATFRVGKTGAGVPAPCTANRTKESRRPMTPSVISRPPANRQAGIPKKGGSSRQREIHRGTKPATNPGATTRKTAEPTIANTRLTMSSCKQVVKPSAMKSASPIAASASRARSRSRSRITPGPKTACDLERSWSQQTNDNIGPKSSHVRAQACEPTDLAHRVGGNHRDLRSEEHTSEL